MGTDPTPRRTTSAARSKAPRQPASERVYSEVKADILSNRLAPGALLPLERYIRQFRMSRTPVREAVLRLVNEGLVEVRPRLGTYVSHLDLARIREMYQVRAALESEAARLAVAAGKVESARELERMLAALNTGAGADLRELSEAGQSLHRYLVQASGNRVLQETIQSLQDHFTRFRHLSLQMPEKVLSSHEEHCRIAQALSCEDGEMAAHLVRQHFSHAARSLVEGLLGPAAHPSPGITIRVAG
jgi:DNA-binding GntR family transcriptional regulator